MMDEREYIATTTAQQRHADRAAGRGPWADKQAAQTPVADKPVKSHVTTTRAPEARVTRPATDPTAQAIMASPLASGRWLPMARALATTQGVTANQADDILRSAGAIDPNTIALRGV